ncbi:MAG: hypothetical protein WEB79_10915 [Thermoleophilaceae bacterium]
MAAASSSLWGEIAAAPAGTKPLHDLTSRLRSRNAPTTTAAPTS